MIKNINGLNINYFEKGKGPLVVLLHGWGSNISLFTSMTEVLCKKYKVVAMDMPGFGGSDEPKDIWSVDNYTDFVIDFVREYNADEVVFLGHSFGGRVIIKMFERESLPFKISKLILTGSAGIVPQKTPKQIRRQKIYKMTRKIYSSALFTKIFPNAVENLRKKHGSADYNAASPVMRQILVKVVNEDLSNIFPKVTPSTLLIWGKNDTATPLADGKAMESAMPNAALVVLDNSGHYAFLDEMFAFNKILASFMNI